MATGSAYTLAIHRRYPVRPPRPTLTVIITIITAKMLFCIQRDGRARIGNSKLMVSERVPFSYSHFQSIDVSKNKSLIYYIYY